MPRSSATPPLPPDIKVAVERWFERRNIPLQTDAVYEWQAIAALSIEGCNAADIVSLLELLWRHGQTAKFERGKNRRENLLDNARGLVKRFYRLAQRAEDLSRQLGITTSTPAARSEIDSEADEILIVEAEREVWDVMREWADNMKYFVELQTDDELPFQEPFTRQFAGTLPCLVIATALIREATGRPHYREIATLLATICPKQQSQERSEAAIQKAVTRFMERNQEFVEEFLKEGQVRDSVSQWLGNLNPNPTQ